MPNILSIMNIRYDLFSIVSIHKTEMNMDYENIYHTTSIYHYWLHYLYVEREECRTQNSK